VPGIVFDERPLEATVPDLREPGTWMKTQVRWRRDPLTGRSARLLTGVKLQPPTRPELAELTAKPAFCPFCADHLEQATVEFPAELTDRGRIRQGLSVVVPNVLAYATHSAVGIYDSERHFLDLDELTAPIVGDAIGAMLEHTRAVRRFDPTAAWGSISANYLPPSGSSLVHPHLQSAHDACGTTAQRTLVAASAAWPGSGTYWQELIEEETGGARWLGRIGRVAWLTPFAPTGFHEVWGIVEGAHDLTDLDDADDAALGDGLARVFATYRAWNLTSFNFALLGGGPSPDNGRYEVVLKVVTRSNAEPMYRSDATFFERLHDEAMIDLSPEEVAAEVRARF
jgi:galactose-1-phosphate uridylyltransferase